MKKNQRQESILLSLKKLDYLTRSQIQIIHDLKSDRNAQRVLKAMEEYLHVIKDGENIYYLNSKGRELIDCDKVRKSTGNIQHYIMRNYLYIVLGCPSEWENEMKITHIEGNEKITCRPDALIKKGDIYTVIEVDNTQTMKKNLEKIDKYRVLRQRGAFGFFAPKFIWITTTEHRRKELMAASQGLNVEVYTVSDFKNRER
ncbi:hypothetical protein D0469_07065 [Peribacillus saganii]|uniref:Replication-relaxation n=1 Tax=Peribacillus saganii TaxID=2303992 RepID=A0A372LS34_9BACI|nr:hypothetical protein D0469_07065 [Peribacillus saganii]